MINAVKMLKTFFVPPPKEERRLHRRALRYWEEAAAGRKYVPLQEFDFLAFEDQSSHGFLLDLTQLAEPVLAHVGPVLSDEAGLDGTPILLKDVGRESLLARFANEYARVLETGNPVTADYEFVTPAGYRVLCRGVLVPLSKSGSVVDHVCGWVSWKSEKVADAEEMREPA